MCFFVAKGPHSSDRLKRFQNFQSDEPNDEDLEDAVARIQASYRGYKARSGAMARNNKVINE